MTRYSGKVGYGSTEEPDTGSGVWVDTIVEYDYFGDVIRANRQLEPGQNLNDNLSVQNSISIVADQYANDNFMNIRYIEWDGLRWKVSGVQLQPPRLIFTLGDIYNGPLPEEE